MERYFSKLLIIISGVLILLAMYSFNKYQSKFKNMTETNFKEEVAPELISVATSNVVWNGVTTTADGRIFVEYPHLEGEPGMRVGEILKNGTVVPYPNEAWNSYKPGDDPKEKFMRTNGLRVSADDLLWIVDSGTPKNGGSPVAGGVKLVAIDTRTNKVSRVIDLFEYVKDKTYTDDLRIGNGKIYITDAGAPAIIVLDYKTGKGRRVLEDQPCTTDSKPILAEGQVLKSNDGKEVRIHADQLELSPDGSVLYFQALAGPLYKIETKYLNDPSVSDTELASHVTLFYDSPSTGGTAIDIEGNIYLNDVDHGELFKISPQGKSTVLLKGLKWIDAPWIDNNGYLWLPEAQLNRTPTFQNGISKVYFPLHIYKIKINKGQFKS